MTMQEKLRIHREIEQHDLERWHNFTPRTPEAAEILEMLDTASPVVYDAMIRAATLYIYGSEQQKQTLDRIALELPSWPRIMEILEQAEAE